KLLWTSEGHHRSIHTIAFSDNAPYLASSSNDSCVIIWNMRTGKQVQSISARQGPITVIRWYCDTMDYNSCFLISGGMDGTLRLWKKPDKGNIFFKAGMFTLSEACVEDIVVHDSTCRVAAVARGHIVVLSLDVRCDIDPFQPMAWEPLAGLPLCKSVPRRVHFFKDRKAVFIAFLDSKDIIVWGLPVWNELWQSKLLTRIGHTAWSSETRHLLVWNLHDGIDVYCMMENSQPILIRNLHVKIRRNNPKQVELGWHGEIAINSTDNGEIQLCEVMSGNQRCILHH
ncbi:WD40-repeat-containing domain protein, partial [Pisolithus tinctorius]